MKNILLKYTIILGLVSCYCISCSESPTPVVESETFPLTYTFLNKNDTTVKGGFEIYMARYYPKVDSSYTTVTRVQEIGIPTQYIFDEKPAYSGVEAALIFSAMKVWPDDWPDREPLYQTLKWFYIERRTVHDSSEATISFKWPADTARADVHEFDPDTTDGDFGFEGSVNGNFKGLFRKLHIQ